MATVWERCVGSFGARGPLYRIVLEVETVAVEASARGDADGQGTWRFEPIDQGTRMEYEWRIHLANPWMRRLAPLAAPHSSGTTTA